MKKPAALRRPAVVVPILLALGAAVVFGIQAIRAVAAAAAQRAQLLLDVEAATGNQPPDGDELSRLAARLQKIEGHATDRDLVAAMARIEFARGRVDRAAAMFLPFAAQPGASAADQRFGATLLLRQHEAGLPDRGAAATTLQRALGFAQQAYAEGQDAADLTTAWLAALRLPERERAAQLAEQLDAGHASSPGGRLARALRDARLDMPRGDLDALRKLFATPPVEIDARLALVVLQQGDLAGAVAVVEPALLRAPGVAEIRWAAAVVFHACALGHAAGSAERAPWLERRDAQLDWLLEQAPADDPLRERWAALRQER
ncbi:MAG: hypothetical protein FJ265_12095 [Planctomycetes bacterium]|nr:hypothetical protein [Planctomycetota bacterium]